MHSQAVDLTYTKYKEGKKWGCLSERIYLHTESKVQVYLHVIQVRFTNIHNINSVRINIRDTRQ